jgi:A118 family predicted phage portal protein
MNITKKGDKVYCLFEIHKWNVVSRNKENGEPETVRLYTIENELYESESINQQDSKKVPLGILYPDLEPIVQVEGLTLPMFQYLKPNIANNMDIGSPLGLSIYANAMDTLLALDTAFDSFITEFRLGKRRIIVPTSALRMAPDLATGKLVRYFDADDEVYQGVDYGDPDKQKITDNTVELRVEEHLAAINGLLNLYATQTGFSAGTFTFDGASVKTATEIISENSKTFKTIRSNENLLEEGLTKFIKIVTEVCELYEIVDMPQEDYEVDVYWDDSILGDKYTDSDYYIKLNSNGMMPKVRAMMKILGITREQAEEYLKEIKDEQATMTPDLTETTSLSKIIGPAETVKTPPKQKAKIDKQKEEIKKEDKK